MLASINPRGQSLKIFLVVVSDAHFTNHKIKKGKKTLHASLGRFVGWGERDGEDKEQKESAVGGEAFADGKNHCLW